MCNAYAISVWTGQEFCALAEARCKDRALPDLCRLLVDDARQSDRAAITWQDAAGGVCEPDDDEAHRVLALAADRMEKSVSALAEGGNQG